MGTTSNGLTALSIKNAKTGKHFDGGGLYLEVTPKGARYWRMKYRYGGKESRLSFGSFKDVSLAEARQRRDETRAKLRDGKDPAGERKAAKQAIRQNKDGAFPVVAAAWLAHKRGQWAAETHRKAKYVVDSYLIPALRRHPISTLSTK